MTSEKYEKHLRQFLQNKGYNLFEQGRLLISEIQEMVQESNEEIKESERKARIARLRRRMG